MSLTIIIGRYACDRYLPELSGTVTEIVRASASLLPERAAFPHPSPRNNIWLKKNPWFERTVLPGVRDRVASVLDGAP